MLENISICSLLNAESKARIIFDIKGDSQLLYFMIYDAKDKKLKRASDIAINYNKRKKDILNLIKFLRNWKKDISKFWLDCECFSDAFRFIKIKKNFFKDKNDYVYIDFFYSGEYNFFRRKRTLEVCITKQQAEILANQLERFLKGEIDGQTD